LNLNLLGSVSKGKTLLNIKGHLLFGKLFKAVMSPLGVVVNTEFKVMSDPPKVDILIIKKSSASWTKDQLRLVPDGIRDSNARYIILEFKYTQSLSDKTFQQALGYDYFLGEHYKLSREDLQTFIISSKTPREKFLNEHGYTESNVKGVYKSNVRILRGFPIIVLNKLSETHHNALIKAFASRKTEREKAEKLFKEDQFLDIIPASIVKLIIDIFNYIFHKPEEEITMKISPQKAAEISRFVDVFVNTNLSLKEVLAQYQPDEVLSHYKTDEVLSRYKPDEVLSHYKPKEVLSHYKPDEVLSHYKPKEVLSRYKPQDILSGLDKKQLRQLKQHLNNIE